MRKKDEKHDKTSKSQIADIKFLNTQIDNLNTKVGSKIRQMGEL